MIKEKGHREAYRLARGIMKDRAVSFYQVFKNLPKDRFEGVTAVYAFCRYVDDIVDNATTKEEILDALGLLDKVEKDLRSLYSSEEIVVLEEDKLWWLAFTDTIKRFKIPIDSFLAQIEGQRKDIDFEDIKTIEELVEYSRLVAGSVGTMMLPIIAAEGVDINNIEFVKACENLGIGMQITNILRDIGEDLNTRNRLYIPKELLIKYDIERSELEELSLNSELEIPEKVISLWEELAHIADNYYQDYESWLDYFHPKSQIPLVAAALVYQAIAEAIRNEGYKCFTKRCYTSTVDRTRLIYEAKKRVNKRRKTKY